MKTVFLILYAPLGGVRRGGRCVTENVSPDPPTLLPFFISCEKFNISKQDMESWGWKLDKQVDEFLDFVRVSKKIAGF